MEIEGAVDTISQWLTDVHVDSAPIRVAEMLEQNDERDAARPRSGSNSLIASAPPKVGGPDKAPDRSLSGAGATMRVCIHESAHAVAAHASGLRVGRACVRQDDTGAVTYSDDPEDHFAVIIVHLAGMAAELLCGVDERRQFALAHGHDILAARLALDAFPLGDARSFAIAACCAVVSNMQTIERVAHILGAVGELSGAEIAALCGAPQ
jgi:hypothetical protein